MNTDIETWKDSVFYDDITGHMQPIYKRNISLLFHASRGKVEQKRDINVIITLIMTLVNVPDCQKDKTLTLALDCSVYPVLKNHSNSLKLSLQLAFQLSHFFYFNSRFPPGHWPRGIQPICSPSSLLEDPLHTSSQPMSVCNIIWFYQSLQRSTPRPGGSVGGAEAKVPRWTLARLPAC